MQELKEIEYAISQLYESYVNTIMHKGKVCETCLTKLLISLSVSLTQLVENHCDSLRLKAEILESLPPLHKIVNLH